MIKTLRSEHLSASKVNKEAKITRAFVCISSSSKAF